MTSKEAYQTWVELDRDTGSVIEAIKDIRTITMYSERTLDVMKRIDKNTEALGNFLFELEEPGAADGVAVAVAYGNNHSAEAPHAIDIADKVTVK